ncbi:hypothetical protein [Streptacidiphilus rugosus]|nr:hypothetical protein [Streptacidiphilus rugosus]
MSNSTRSPKPSVLEQTWHRWLDPATLPGAVLATVISRLIVLALTTLL